MATLYLHIGHGKTGTSWIQSSLRLSIDAMAAHGIVYAKGDDAQISQANRISSGNAVNLLKSKENFETVLATNRLTRGNALLFSSEFLFPDFYESEAEKFIGEVALSYGFNKIKILLFIRDPIKAIVSDWQQNIKRKGVYDIPLFKLHEYIKTGSGGSNDVEKILDRVEGCPSIELRLKNYSRCKNHLLRELASWLEVPVDTFRHPAVSRVNRSMTYPELVLQMELNRILGESGDLISDPLCEKLPDISPDSILPPLDVQEAMWEKIKPDVERVNTHLPLQHQYRCDIEEPPPLPEQLCYSYEQISVIAEALGNEIKQLRNVMAHTSTTVTKLEKTKKQMAEDRKIIDELRSQLQSVQNLNQKQFKIIQDQQEALSQKNKLVLKVSAALVRIVKPTFIYTILTKASNKYRWRKQIKLINHSGLFDENYYLKKYPDVRSANINPVQHFIRFGGSEGRNPSKGFNSAFYLADNPDVAKSGINPLIHYLNHGKDEGRQIKSPDKVKNSAPIKNKNPLKSYFYSNQKNAIYKWSHYFDIYHRHFQHFVGKECVILEIGVLHGGSLQMWKNYFGSKARIIGIDINPESKKYEEPQIEIYIGSQSDRVFLSYLKTKILKIDILIDDGGHRMEEQIIAFEELFDHVNDDGIYLCEDTHTSYWDEYGGGLGKATTFIEYSKTLIDRLNAWHTRDEELPVTTFTKSVHSLHYYDGIFVIEKKRRTRPWHEMRGRLTNIVEVDDDSSNYFFKLKTKILSIDLPDNIPFEFLINNPQIIEHYFPDKYHGRIWPEKGETMIGFLRLTNLEHCVVDTILENIEGDLIETGVWRGGACIFARAVLQKFGIRDKKVWLADSFDGLPKPCSELYPDDKNDKHHTFDELKVTEEEVRRNFEKYKLLDGQVVFLKGWFKDTLPKAPIEKLSILRLDGDMYESTIDVLFYLYPKLSLGGYCIIDDWGAVAACKKAVEDYRRIFNIHEEVVPIDWTGVFWKKEQELTPISRDDFMHKISQKNHKQIRPCN